jgi:hypothetical protein
VQAVCVDVTTGGGAAPKTLLLLGVGN